ncbi:hypothetical protein PPL_05275 [Heterostelium album PN500]|uniref:Uncharacterized protein n=1 Tax=Heterostelium pallidum (strain ATCC 26659 / Pp 5 / PN500) TaxID=670386 RepID=D3BB89_HETP5|nr:hypothetical protein PPL_05275 [Heterostelium album PN500]EFA81296.1 hypothetical protein PPL_05275 [Heterostelium album PN500]|eukprot:XP_020433414.1 hypothetical protein PPL_05275 [Heterostelium album PN500]
MNKFIIFILLFIYLITIVKVETKDNLSDYITTIDLGCTQYVVSPTSSYIIPDRFNFRIKVIFNGGPMYLIDIPFYDPSIDTTSKMVDLIKQKTLVYMYDNNTKIKYVINTLMILSDRELYFYFKDLPISGQLTFVTETCFSQSDRLYIGPRSIATYSTNGTAPLPPKINSYTSYCPREPVSSSTWMTLAPSALSISPIVTVNPIVCSSSIDVCRSNPGLGYYLKVVFGLNIADGQANIQLGFKLSSEIYSIKSQLNVVGNDTRVETALSRGNSYSIPDESLIEPNSLMQSVTKFTSRYPITNVELASYFQQYNSGVIPKAIMRNSTHKDIPLEKNYNYNKLIEDRDSNTYFIFIYSDNSNVTITTSFGYGVFFQWYETEGIKCPAGSNRNPFTNDAPFDTIHYWGTSGIPYFSYQITSFANTNVTRSLNLGFQNQTFDFTDNNNYSSPNMTIKLTTKSNSEFTNKLIDLNGITILQTSDPSTDITSALFIPTKDLGQQCGQNGMLPSTFYGQPNFCDLPYGSCIYSLSKIIQNGQNTANKILPIWDSTGGYANDGVTPRITINLNSMTMLNRYDNAVLEMHINPFSLPYYEPRIVESGISNNRTTARADNGCDGTFSVDVSNSGDASGVFNIDLQCNQPTPMRILSLFQTLKPGQTLPFSVQILFDRFYRPALECTVTINIRSQTLWSTVDKVASKTFAIPQYPECNIVDPCIGVTSEPQLEVLGFNQDANFTRNRVFVFDRDIVVTVKNSGKVTGEFQTTVTCSTSNQTNFFFKDGDSSVVTTVKPGQTITQTMVLMAEAYPYSNVTIDCSLKTSIYNASICWPTANNQVVVTQFSHRYPNDTCVSQDVDRPLISQPLKFWLDNYNNNNSQPNLDIVVSNSEWIPALYYSLPSQHPLAIQPDANNQGHIYSDATQTNTLYASIFTMPLNNVGASGGRFLFNFTCPNQFIADPQYQVIQLQALTNTTLQWNVYSYSTNLDNPLYLCNLSIGIDNPSKCWNGIGVNYTQQIEIYPNYKKCSGNYYLASLGPDYRLVDNMYFSSWTIKNGMTCIDLSVLVGNIEIGSATVYSNLIGYTDAIEKTSCWLNSQSNCTISYTICSNTSATISTSLTLSIDNGCPGGYTDQSYQFTLSPPAIESCVTAPSNPSTTVSLISNYTIQYIDRNQWLKRDLESKHLSFPIVLNNIGDDMLLVVTSNSNVSGPTITIDYQNSILECLVHGKSHCTMWMTVIYNNTLIDYPNAIISLEFAATDPIDLNSTSCLRPPSTSRANMTINIELPKPICSNSPSQASFLFTTEQFRDNPSIISVTSNPLSIYFGKWIINNNNNNNWTAPYENVMFGQLQNRGNGSGIMILNIECFNNPTTQSLLIDTNGFTNHSYLMYPNEIIPFKFNLYTLNDKQVLPLNCIVRAKFQTELCWSDYGTQLSQIFQIPFNAAPIPQTDDNYTSSILKKLLMGIFIPLAVLLASLLLLAVYRQQPWKSLKRSSVAQTKPVATPTPAQVVATPTIPVNCICGDPIFSTCTECPPPGNIYCAKETCQNYNLSGTIHQFTHQHPHPLGIDTKENYLSRSYQFEIDDYAESRKQQLFGRNTE